MSPADRQLAERAPPLTREERETLRRAVEEARRQQIARSTATVTLDCATIDAARETLRWFNSRCVELAPGPIDRLLAIDLTEKRDWALHALINHGGKGWAKREQLAITDGHALAICTGGRSHLEWAKGCYSIFEEKPNISGKKWPRLCEHCQPSSGHRNPYRDARRARQARAKQIADIRSTS